LYEIIRQLLSHSPHNQPRAGLRIETAKSDEYGLGAWLHQNWHNPNIQARTLTSLFESVCDVNVRVREKQDVPHARSLQITWADGKAAELVLDQGVGFCRTLTRVPHSFTASAEDQARSMRNAKFQVEQWEKRIPIYVMPAG
jgi:hypothetical protein